MITLDKKADRLGDVGEIALLLLISVLFTSIITATVVGASILIGDVLYRCGLLSDEGTAWFGIRVGLPFGFVCGCFAFVACFRKIRRFLH